MDISSFFVYLNPIAVSLEKSEIPSTSKNKYKNKKQNKNTYTVHTFRVDIHVNTQFSGRLCLAVKTPTSSFPTETLFPLPQPMCPFGLSYFSPRPTILFLSCCWAVQWQPTTSTSCSCHHIPNLPCHPRGK